MKSSPKSAPSSSPAKNRDDLPRRSKRIDSYSTLRTRDENSHLITRKRIKQSSSASSPISQIPPCQQDILDAKKSVEFFQDSSSYLIPETDLQRSAAYSEPVFSDAPSFMLNTEIHEKRNSSRPDNHESLSELFYEFSDTNQQFYPSNETVDPGATIGVKRPIFSNKSEWQTDPFLKQKYSKYKCPYCARLFKNSHGWKYHLQKFVCSESKLVFS